MVWIRPVVVTVDTLPANAARRSVAGLIGAVSVTAALIFAPTGASAAEAGIGSDGIRVAAVRVGVESTAQGAAAVSSLRAIRIGVVAVKGGRVVELELERRAGRLVWELEIVSRGSEYDIRIDARTGKVLRVKRDRPTTRANTRLLAAAKVGATKAAQIALRTTPGARLHALDLERSRSGTVVWQADIVTRRGLEYDVVIDARTGKVLAKKLDD